MVLFRDHQPIMLEADQEVIIYAAGAEYTTWEGYKTPEETKIGVSYGKLCMDINPGQTILIADGTICIQVIQTSSFLPLQRRFTPMSMPTRRLDWTQRRGSLRGIEGRDCLPDCMGVLLGRHVKRLISDLLFKPLKP